jgi:hypothetical protein
MGSPLVAHVLPAQAAHCHPAIEAQQPRWEWTMTQQELERWWDYWTPEHYEADERDTNGGKYRPLPDEDKS